MQLRRVLPAGVALAGLVAVGLLYEPRMQVPWAVVDRESDHAIIQYQHGHCDRLRYVRVTETDEEIKLRVIVSERSYTCQLNLEYSKVKVELGSSTKPLVGCTIPRPKC